MVNWEAIARIRAAEDQCDKARAGITMSAEVKGGVASSIRKAQYHLRCALEELGEKEEE